MPKVGVGVIVKRDGKILLGKRRNAHGDGTWGFPGGHLVMYESWETCARREVDEEVGIEIENVRFFDVTNDIFSKEQKHYITIFMLAEYLSGVVQVREPHKMIEWEWFSLKKLPDPLFLPIQNLLQQNAMDI